MHVVFDNMFTDFMFQRKFCFYTVKSTCLNLFSILEKVKQSFLALQSFKADIDKEHLACTARINDYERIATEAYENLKSKRQTLFIIRRDLLLQLLDDKGAHMLTKKDKLDADSNGLAKNPRTFAPQVFGYLLFGLWVVFLGLRLLWRSLEELSGTPEFTRYLQKEFPRQAPRDMMPLSRRDFMRLMGAAMALVMPAVGAMAPEVADMSVREIRKNKADAVFISSGDLWVSRLCQPLSFSDLTSTVFAARFRCADRNLRSIFMIGTGNAI